MTYIDEIFASLIALALIPLGVALGFDALRRMRKAIRRREWDDAAVAWTMLIFSIVILLIVIGAALVAIGFLNLRVVS